VADAGYDERERRDALRGAEATAPRPTGTGAATAGGRNDDARFRQVDGTPDGSASGELADSNDGRRNRKADDIRGGSANVTRLEGQPKTDIIDEWLTRSAGSGYWDDIEWIYCLDDKWRAIESGTAPLVDGLSTRLERKQRVNRLKGYGNAIVPQVGAVFLQAYMTMDRRSL